MNDLNTNDLIDAINKIDTYYEMSDSILIYQKNHENIKKLVEEFNKSKEKDKIISSLTSIGKFNFQRYFKII